MYDGMNTGDRGFAAGKAALIKLVKRSYTSDWTLKEIVGIPEKSPCPILPRGYQTKCAANHFDDGKTEIVIPSVNEGSVSNCTAIFHYPSMKWTKARPYKQSLPILDSTLMR